MNELLLRMLAASLRRNIDDTSFQKFQQCLLHALSRNVAGNRRVVPLAGDLVDFINEDNASFRLCQIIIRFLEKTGKQALHILAHITRLGKHGRVHNRERDLQQPGY